MVWNHAIFCQLKSFNSSFSSRRLWISRWSLACVPLLIGLFCWFKYRGRWNHLTFPVKFGGSKRVKNNNWPQPVHKKNGPQISIAMMMTLDCGTHRRMKWQWRRKPVKGWLQLLMERAISARTTVCNSSESPSIGRPGRTIIAKHVFGLDTARTFTNESDRE